MSKIIDLYDRYDLRVRMSVGIIVLSPILISLYLLIPEVRSISFTAMILIISFGMCNLIIAQSRYYGRNASTKCFNQSKPAQRMLLPSDQTPDSQTKERYHSFFSSKIKGVTFEKDTQDIDAMCNTAISWLISQTRDSSKFPLIKEELINYGFAKNLYGMKSIGIIISVALILIEITALGIQHHTNLNIAPTRNLAVSIIISFCYLLMWILVVKKEWVIECGEKYARSLLSACDSDHFTE